MKLFTRSLAALAAATILAGAADAATQVFTYDFGNPVHQNTDINNNFSLTGFDSSLGTLTSVIVTYGLTNYATGTITNTSAGTSTIKEGAETFGTITFGGAYTDNSGVSLDALTQKTFSNVASGATVNFNPTPGTDSGTTGNLLASYLADTALTGNFSTLTGSNETIIPNGGSVDKSISTSASGYVTVTYAYDAPPPSVPEPASWAMMVGGFGMLGGALRRKRGTTAVTFG